ncbi:MAG: preprotein translocase subunit SecE [Terracidiphilus sp.]
MASKALMANGDDRPDKRQGSNPVSKFSGGVVGQWKEFTQFLSDVRAEMRKVVTPSWKEVKSTTTVVIIAVAIFGVYFFLIDGLFSIAMNRLLQKLGGLQ